MSRIRGKDTRTEVRVRSALHRKGLRFRKHLKQLPGNPDIVFSKIRIAVFIDGDFWHGYRFASWKDKVSDFWKNKISRTRERDAGNIRRLRRLGWIAIRIWEHQLDLDFNGCIDRLTELVRKASKDNSVTAVKQTKNRK